MKATITLHGLQDSQLSSVTDEIVVIKGDRLVVNQAENNTFVISEDGEVLGIYPNVKRIDIKGKAKPVQVQNGYATNPATLIDQITAALTRSDLSDHLKNCIAHGIVKAEQMADEKSQARRAVESNPVATAHPDFDAFINSKMTSEDCAQFGVAVARMQADINLDRALQAEQRLAELEADVAADDLPQAMQDREMLYSRITALQNRIAGLDYQSTFDDTYSRGLFNGLLTAESIMTGEPAKLVEDPALVEERRYKEPAIIDPEEFQATAPCGNDESNNIPVAGGGSKKK